MKNLIQKFFQVVLGIVLLGCAVSAHAFNSMYVFGDALTTTTNNSANNQFYYGKRFSNGRVWVEVLAQRQGVGISNNWSYFDCNSGNLWTNTQHFSISQTAASNALFVIWCNNSDLFDAVMNAPNTNQSTWVPIINRAQTNEFRAITNLYAKGVRTIIMPNAVDVGKVPYFYLDIGNFAAIAPFVRQECIAYNVAFANTLNQARAACPGLTIYQPDFFGLLDNVLTNSAHYGLTNALNSSGVSIDAMDALYPNCNTNGLGANYVFWDYLDPSARFHAIIADYTQQGVSPAQIAQITPLGSSNQLAVVNTPIGLNGFIETCTNLTAQNWTPLKSVSSLNATQAYLVPAPVGATTTQQFGPKDIVPGPGGTVQITALAFYRMNYPYAWVWP